MSQKLLGQAPLGSGQAAVNGATKGVIIDPGSAYPDPGTMEYWDAIGMPPAGPNGLSSGTMEYWDTVGMPNILTMS